MTKSAPPSSSLQNPLWDFSIDFYGHDGVKSFLLDCQDTRGADVCLLLWASYVEASGRQLSEESWRIADRGLAPRRRIIGSVRGVRRWLKKLGPRASNLYRRCLRWELQLEQRQLAALWQLQQEAWPEDRDALALAGQQYGLPQKEQARWAGLIEGFTAGRDIVPI